MFRRCIHDQGLRHELQLIYQEIRHRKVIKNPGIGIKLSTYANAPQNTL